LYYVSHQTDDIHLKKGDSASADLAESHSETGYYSDHNIVDESLSTSSQYEVDHLTLDDCDREVWATVKKNFDLSVFQVGVAANFGAPHAIVEETVEDNDEHDFNVAEVVAQYCSSAQKDQEHSYA